MLTKETLLRSSPTTFRLCVLCGPFGRTLEGKNGVNRSSNGSEFRHILSRLKEVQEKLERSDQSSLASELSDINDSLSIIEGTQTELQTLDRMQTAIQDDSRAMERGFHLLEAKINTHSRVEGSNGTEMPLTPPSSARKRKIARHRDL